MEIRSFLIDNFIPGYLSTRKGINDMYHSRGNYTTGRFNSIAHVADPFFRRVDVAGNQSLIVIGGRSSIVGMADRQASVLTSVDAQCGFGVAWYRERGTYAKTAAGASSLMKKVRHKPLRSIRNFRKTANDIRYNAMDEGRALTAVAVIPHYNSDRAAYAAAGFATFNGPTRPIGQLLGVLADDTGIEIEAAHVPMINF